ncbi:hypothetical protein ACIBCT_25560 [Streptosporangium sp. NPDC050855]
MSASPQTHAYDRHRHLAVRLSSSMTTPGATETRPADPVAAGLAAS